MQAAGKLQARDFLSIVETGISYQLTIIIMARVLVCMKIGRRYY